MRLVLAHASVRWFFLVALLVFGVLGCKSKESVTAREISCNTRDVKIVASEYSRAGSLTRWCARCDGVTYVCVTNPQLDPVDCRKVEPGPPCQ